MPDFKYPEIQKAALTDGPPQRNNSCFKKSFCSS